MLFTASLFGLLLGAAAPAASTPISALSLGPAPTLATLDAVSDLIAKGQKELVAGKNAEALASFEAAHEKSGGKAETDVWVQRARMANGALDEAFEMILELESTVEDPSLMAYAIGTGRYLFAKREEARGGDPGGAFDEARGYLKDAIDVAPDAFPDAWRMLAESARWVGDQDTASMAIGRALETSKDAATLGLAAKIRVAAGSAMLGSDDTKDAGKRMITQGVEDARAAIKALGAKKENAVALADLNLQLGVGLLFLEKKDEAADAYAEAMGWDPTQVDYGQLFGIFTDAEGTSRPFVDALDAGATKFESHWGKNIASDAGLRWWLGYGQQRLGDYDDAIANFEAAVQKFPAFANSYWYIGLSKYNKGIENYEDAAKSWRQYATVDRDGFIATVNGDPTNIRILDFAGAKLYGNGMGRNNNGMGMEAAADIYELVLMTDPSNAKYWNNVGLFHRDAGQVVAQLTARTKDYEPQMTAMEHYERSWEAYQKALEMARTSYHLNDAAVLLHYYLERDYDEAIAMYNEAEAMASARLEKGGLSAEEKPLVEIALRDSKDNRKKLMAKIEKAKKKEAPKEGDGEGGDGAGGTGK
ncbi:Tetratricopeptide repeat protein [Planctomycetes bacterium Poly30]|uniref:Tetratricopeptide repeat protein n=1 Tax=Saltatorellus ferox TaxID=2528018 RepID=A0A518ER40_9BACT|nr:Tetratricopeptide repeat protein [Planctomycetes bacterium Poly30]